jgi:Sulfatase
MIDMWRNYRLSLSSANLIYLRGWADLIPLNDSDLYNRKAMPGFHIYFALVGDVLALSLLIFAVLSLAPKLPVWMRRCLPVAAVAAMAIAVSFLRGILLHYVSGKMAAAFLFVVFLCAAVLVVRFSALAIRLIKGLALAATPCLAVTFVAPLYYLSRPSPLPPDPPLAQRLAGTPEARVLWIVFDDWDQRLTFENPAAAPPIPTVMSLSDRSFTATRALAALSPTPVVDMATANAIPSLLYGKLLVNSDTDDDATRNLLFAGNREPVVLGSGDSVFARVRSQGWNSAAAGWYLPYCRIFGPQLTDCYWDVRYDQASSAGASPLRAAVDETRMLFETDMYSPFGRSLVGARHFEEYDALLAAAKRYATDPTIALAFVHFNIPHTPYFYNPDLGRFGRKGHPDDLYIDALKWVDRAVGEILTSVNQAGLDSKTAIILSSDHPARLVLPTDPHVPFIVHLPGEKVGVVSVQEFSALGTADLAMAIAQGQIQTPHDIEKFLIHRQP